MSISVDLQVNVTTCLDQLKEALYDGGAIIEKIKRKRALKRAPPPPRLLEESIDQAPHEIEREKQRCVNQVGAAFDAGDHIAIIQLQQVTIQLQASLLRKLRHAAFDDDTKTTDFSYLADTVDMGRDRTISIMRDLEKRLTEEEDGHDEEHDEDDEIAPPPGIRSTSPNQTLPMDIPPKNPRTNRRVYSMQQPERRTMPAPLERKPTWAQEYGSHTQSGEEEATSGAEESSHETHRHRKRTSLLQFLKQNRSTSTSEKFPTLIREEIPPTASPNPHSFRLPPHVSEASYSGSRFNYDAWEDDSPELWGSSKPSFDRRETIALAPDVTLTPGGPERQLSSTGSVTGHQPPSPALTNRTNPLVAIAPSNSASGIPNPTPENDYLGFCKYAWKLQNGDRKGSMSKNREVEPWSRHPSNSTNATYYLACNANKCAFRSNFTHSDIDQVWNKVFTVAARGLKFRWSFLAKSHVLQKVVVKQQYSFKCLFCIFLRGKSGVYHGIDYYLEHVANEHRGQRAGMGDVVLYKTGCVMDRVADDGEDFDINLWPWGVYSGSLERDRQKSEWWGDELMIGGGDSLKDGNDSMFSASEPWNEGLSDFHYRGEFDLE